MQHTTKEKMIEEKNHYDNNNNTNRAPMDATTQKRRKTEFLEIVIIHIFICMYSSVALSLLHSHTHGHCFISFLLLAFSFTSSSLSLLSSTPSSSSFHFIAFTFTFVRSLSFLTFLLDMIAFCILCVKMFVSLVCARFSFLLFSFHLFFDYLLTYEWMIMFVCLLDRARFFGARPVQIPAYVRCKIAKNLSLSSWTKKKYHTNIIKTKIKIQQMIPQNLLVLECMFSALAPSVFFPACFPLYLSMFCIVLFSPRFRFECVCLCEFFVRTLHFYQHVIRHAVFTYACSNQMVNSLSVPFSLFVLAVSLFFRTHYIRIKFNVDLVLHCVPLWFSHSAHCTTSPLWPLTVKSGQLNK